MIKWHWAMFAKGLSRPVVLLTAVAAFCAIPAKLVARGPNLCLFRLILHHSSCPACGSTRALAAFFHGQFTQALAFNRNVAITGPLILILLGSDLVQLARNAWRQRRTSAWQNCG